MNAKEYNRQSTGIDNLPLWHQLDDHFHVQHLAIKDSLLKQQRTDFTFLWAFIHDSFNHSVRGNKAPLKNKDPKPEGPGRCSAQKCGLLLYSCMQMKRGEHEA